MGSGVIFTADPIYFCNYLNIIRITIRILKISSLSLQSVSKQVYSCYSKTKKMSGLIGKKIGMTSLYNADGQALACTVIQAGPCVVT